MLGKQTASLQSGLRRRLHSFWGYPNIDARQKWSLLWPTLSELPTEGLRLLDAGCGDGHWALELAVRRRGWSIVGIDNASEAVENAEKGRARLELQNLRILETDFFAYEPRERFDVVLSVASAHYLAEAGLGRKLFARFAGWLKTGGLLLLFAPRRRKDVPLLPGLPSRRLHDVFSREGLEELCHENHLAIQSLEPCIGPFGTAAKQLSFAARNSKAARAVSYPMELLLTWIDRGVQTGADPRSSAWRLIARCE